MKAATQKILIACFYVFLSLSMHGYTFAFRLSETPLFNKRFKGVTQHSKSEVKQQHKTVVAQWGDSEIHLNTESPFYNHMTELIETRNQIKAESEALALQQHKAEVRELVLTVIGLSVAAVALLMSIASWAWDYMSAKLNEWKRQALEKELNEMRSGMCANLASIESDFDTQLNVFLNANWPSSTTSIRATICATETPLCKMLKIIQDRVKLSIKAFCGSRIEAEAAAEALGAISVRVNPEDLLDTTPLHAKLEQKLGELKETFETVTVPAAFIAKLGDTLQWWHLNPALSQAVNALSPRVASEFTSRISQVTGTTTVTTAASIAGIFFSLYSISSSINKMVTTTEKFYEDRRQIINEFNLKSVDLTQPMCKIMGVVMFAYSVMKASQPPPLVSGASSGSGAVVTSGSSGDRGLALGVSGSASVSSLPKKLHIGPTPEALEAIRRGGLGLLETDATQGRRGFLDFDMCCGAREKTPKPDMEKVPRSAPRTTGGGGSASASASCLPCPVSVKPKSLQDSYQSTLNEFVDRQCPSIIGWTVDKTTTMAQLVSKIPTVSGTRKAVYGVVVTSAGCETLTPTGTWTKATDFNGKEAPALPKVHPRKYSATTTPVHVCYSYDRRTAPYPGMWVTGINAHFRETRDDSLALCFGARPGKVTYETCDTVESRVELSRGGFSREARSQPFCTDQDYYKDVSLWVHYGRTFSTPPLSKVYVSSSKADPAGSPTKSGSTWVMNGKEVQQVIDLNLNSCGGGSPAYLGQATDYFFYDFDLALA